MKYNYDLVHSKRKTVSIVISSENKITVRCPIGLSRERAEKFLKEKESWIKKTLLKNDGKRRSNADVINLRSVYVNGVKRPLYLGGAARGTDENGVFAKSVKDIKRLFIERFAEDFSRSVREISKKTGLNFSELNLKSYKSRWGCCDTENNITFNYKVFMLPERVRYYIVIHELCHTVQHNHSENFWRLVGGILPDYKRLRKELREYDFLTTLY